jgi:preprotein translocase SecE subunit
VEEVKKYIDFSYLLGLLLITWLVVKVVGSLWGIWDGMPDPKVLLGVHLSTLVGIVAGISLTAYLRFNAKVYKAVSECGVELKKTIWPTWEETKYNTIVVIVVSFCLGFILWFFDLIWKNLTDLMYG